MKIPVWLKPAAWGAVAGAIVLAIVGFSQLGWVTPGTAQKMAQAKSDTSVIAALVPFCVDKAKADPDAALMTKLKAEQSSYSRSDVVTKAGWATLNGDKFPNSDLARACSERLFDMKVG